MLLVVGCSNPALKVNEASKKMEELDNFSFKFSFDIAGEQDGEEQEFTMIMNGKTDNKNKTGYMTTNILGMEIKIYTKEENGNVVTYTENIFGESGWTKSVAPVTEESSMVDVDGFLSLLDKALKISEVSSDVNGMTKYQLTLSVDDMKEIMNSTGETLDEDDVTLKEDGEAVISIYITSEGYMGKMIMDMTDLIEATEEATFSKLSFTIEFDDFNKAEVIIPTDVVNNAVESSNFELE
jgi:hypothetical protein